MVQKWFESIGWWIHYEACKFDLIHELDLGYSRSTFEIYIRSELIDMRMLNPLRDLETMNLTLGFQDQLPWNEKGIALDGSWANYVTLTLIFKVKFRYNHISEMWGPIDMRMLYPMFDLELWSWPWIFKVKFDNNHISGLGGPIDMKCNR